MKKTIYLDMDGVLVDFDTHFEKLHGVTPASVGEENFWKVFDTKRDGFFRDCPPYDLTFVFVDHVLKLADIYDYKVEILTALPRRSTHPDAAREKQDWCNMNGLSHIKMNVGPYAIDKQKWYREGDILIDDKDLNVEQWRAKGGWAVYHEPGNFLKSIGALEVILATKDIPEYVPA